MDDQEYRVPPSPDSWRPTLRSRPIAGPKHAWREERLAVHGTYVIGVHYQCDMVVDDPLVSRRHLELRVNSGKVSILDIGSTNGTTVGGRPITGVVPLSSGQEFQIGDTVFQVVYPRLHGDQTPEAEGPRARAGAASQRLSDELRSLDEEHGGRLTMRCNAGQIEQILSDRLSDLPGYSKRNMSRRLEALAAELGVDPELRGTIRIQAIIDVLTPREEAWRDPPR